MPALVFSQEIKSNVVNGFTNERTIETSIVPLKQGFSTGFGISYTAVNRNYYLNIIGYGRGNSLISDSDSIWLVLKTGAIAKLNSRVELSYNETDIQNIYIHHYYISLNMIEALKNTPVLAVRIVSAKGANDIAISKKSGKSLVTLSDVFLKEVSK